MSVPRVLLADDDQISSKVLSSRLKDNGFHVELVHDSMQVAAAMDGFKPDIVLLDILMPQLSGLEVLREIRTKHEKLALPVIMCTSRDDESDIVAALNMGANDYLTKPVNIQVAIARMNAQLSLKYATQKLLRQGQIETVAAMAVTYNHQINNALAVALGSLYNVKKFKIDPEAEKWVDSAESYLHKIAEITAKIGKVAEESQISMEMYTGTTKMVKI